MQKRLLIIALLVAVVAMVGCNQANQPKVTTVGEAITGVEVTPLATLLENPAELVGETVVLEGHVTGRCMGSGCWVSLDTGDPENPFYVKSSDHSFVFPEICVDKDVKVMGVLAVMQPEAKEGEAEAEHEHKEGEVEEEGHVCPTPVYFLEPKGVEIKA